MLVLYYFFLIWRVYHRTFFYSSIQPQHTVISRKNAFEIYWPLGNTESLVSLVFSFVSEKENLQPSKDNENNKEEAKSEDEVGESKEDLESQDIASM